MTGSTNDWATSQLAEFVAVLSSRDHVDDALEAAAERAAEALEAQVAAVTGPEGVLAAVGYRAGSVPHRDLLDLLENQDPLEVPGVGSCRTLATPLDDPFVNGLVVARQGGEFSYQEATLLRGMGRVLVLTLRMLRTIELERSVRAELQERQASLQRLSKIQTSISRRRPLQEVLDAITAGALDLLNVDIAVIRLLEGDGVLRLVSSSGMAPALREAHEQTNVDQGVSGQVVTLKRLVVVHDYAEDERALPSFAAARMNAVMGAPIRGDEGEVIGSLVVASYDPERPYTKADQDLLWVFAEHASLAITDASMVEAKQLAEQQLIQAQKMEAVGNLAGGIAHDFNNLLLVIETSAVFLTETIDTDRPEREDVDAILDAAQRAATLTRQLLLFSRKEVITPETLNVNDVVESMRNLLSRTITHNIELSMELDAAHGWTTIDGGQLEQVLMNLAVNARDAMPRGGCLVLATRNQSVGRAAAAASPGLRPGEYVVIEVKDDGEGMPPDVAERVFEPFFTTKEMGRGTGLGLASVYGIVKRAEGYIDVRSSPGRGSTFTIFLPTASVQVVRPEFAVEDQGSASGEHILVAEDEDAVRHVVSRQLRSAGYSVVEASSGAEALEHFDNSPEPIGVLLTDVIMPGMSGKELADRLLARQPHLKVVYMSGYTHDIIAQEGVLRDGEVFLHKPFSLVELLTEIRRALQPS